LVRILVVNNYPARKGSETLEKCVGGNGATVVHAEWDEVSVAKFDSCDGVVLSGSPALLTDKTTPAKYRKEIDAMTDSRVPIMGVCFGHQLMAHAFGAEVVKDGRHVTRMVKTTVLADDPLFEGLPRSLMLRESRYEVVKSLPEGFNLLAKSETSRIAAMKHPARPLYGAQFHPEAYTKANPEGNRVVGNFVHMLR
jgi:GMP synthase (glutamine-hydrolysing)